MCGGPRQRMVCGFRSLGGGKVSFLFLFWLKERSHFKHRQATSATVLPLLMLLEYLRKLKRK